MGMLAYYWVLATPAVGFLFGCYLYIAVNCFHVHYDEAFSALRIPNFKGFSRLHINTDGDLEIYGLAMDKVGSCVQNMCSSSCCSCMHQDLLLSCGVRLASLSVDKGKVPVVRGSLAMPWFTLSCVLRLSKLQDGLCEAQQCVDAMPV